MKKILSLFFTTLLLTMVVVTLNSSAQTKDKNTIVDVVLEDSTLSTLAKALDAADLVDTLEEGTYTVFAPTNDAFNKLPASDLEDLLKPENKEKLQNILLYHVAPEKLTSRDVLSLIGKTLKMANGEEAKIEIKDEELYIDGAKIIITDIKADNGIIHVIDSVLIP